MKLLNGELRPTRGSSHITYRFWDFANCRSTCFIDSSFDSLIIHASIQFGTRSQWRAIFIGLCKVDSLTEINQNGTHSYRLWEWSLSTLHFTTLCLANRTKTVPGVHIETFGVLLHSFDAGHHAKVLIVVVMCTWWKTESSLSLSI